MNTNEYGQVSFDTDEILSMLYAGQTITDCKLTDQREHQLHNAHHTLFEIDKLNQWQAPTQSAEDYHHTQSKQWQMPDQYKTLDIEKLLSEKLAQKGLTSDTYIARLAEEMIEFKTRNMSNTLRFLCYLMDTCKSQDIVTGIGRGSSVSSLVLHLLDVHHIDPIKYNLDYKEFLR
jgi:DNA polymerase III alpha subunit